MWRSMFIALGVTCCILGAECLAIDRAVLNRKTQLAAVEGQPAKSGAPIVIEPPQWAPWSLLGGGAVVILYSFTIPSRMKG